MHTCKDYQYLLKKTKDIDAPQGGSISIGYGKVLLTSMLIRNKMSGDGMDLRHGKCGFERELGAYPRFGGHESVAEGEYEVFRRRGKTTLKLLQGPEYKDPRNFPRCLPLFIRHQHSPAAQSSHQKVQSTIPIPLSHQTYKKAITSSIAQDAVHHRPCPRVRRCWHQRCSCPLATVIPDLEQRMSSLPIPSPFPSPSSFSDSPSFQRSPPQNISSQSQTY